jgi:hypothetical protein
VARWPWRAVAAGLLALGALILLLAVWRSHRRTDLAVYGAFAFPVAVGAVGLAARIYTSGKAGPRIASDAGELGALADDFAGAAEAG